MEIDGVALPGLLAALRGGLLVGTERERRRGESTAEVLTLDQRQRQFGVTQRNILARGGGSL